MDELTRIMLAAIEQAAISGLCREGQLEIAVQEGRKIRPGSSDEELFEIAQAVHELSV